MTMSTTTVKGWVVQEYHDGWKLWFSVSAPCLTRVEGAAVHRRRREAGELLSYLRQQLPNVAYRVRRATVTLKVEASR